MTYQWDKLDQTGLSEEKIARLIDGCVLAHSDFLSVGLACGIRAAFRMLGEMGGERHRHTVDRAQLRANACVAIAFLVITCVNPCKGTMDFTYYAGPDWEAVGRNDRREVRIKMRSASFADAAAVFAAGDDQLFESVEVVEL